LLCVGIDLAGVEKRPTGFCVLDEKFNVETKILYTDKEIITEIYRIKPDIVAIDAPLARPKKRSGSLRKCDEELKKMGIKFFPINLPTMKKLTERGIRLRKIIEKKFKVIETYPGAAQDILGIPRKQKGIEKLRNGLKKFVKIKKRKISNHELDAITCALVGKMYLDNNCIILGDPKEILMVLPKIP